MKSNVAALESRLEGLTGREKELDKLEQYLKDPSTRGIVIHGAGGAGKTALALMAAHRVSNSFDYLFMIDCRGGFSMEEALFDLGTFFKKEGVGEFDNVVRSAMPVNLKVEFLAQILKKTRTFVLFDNMESAMETGEGPQNVKDTVTAQSINSIISLCTEGSRFIFVSRRDMAFGEQVPENAIGHIEVEPFDGQDYRETVQNAYNTLSDEGRAVLAGVAVFQKPFPALDKDKPESTGELAAHIDELERNGLVERSGNTLRTPLVVREMVAEGLGTEKWNAFLIKTGEFLEEHSKKTQALWHTVNARALYLEAGENERAGELALFITEALRHLGFIEFAAALSRETAETCEGLTKASALHNLGSLSSSLGKNDEALKYYEESLELKRSLGDNKEVAFTLGQIGNLHYQTGAMDKAREAYAECLALSEETGSHASAAAALHQLALILRSEGNTPKAIEYLTLSLDYSKKAGNRQGEASALFQLGSLYQGTGELSLAQEALGKSLSLYEEIDDPSGLSRVRHQLGNLAYQAREYSKALAQYEECLQLKQDLRDASGVATTLLNMGMAYQGTGDMDRAQEQYKLAAESFEELKDAKGYSAALMQSGIVHHHKREYEAAIDKLTNSLKFREATGDRHGAAQCMAQLGLTHQDNGDDRAALRHLLISFSIFHSLNSPYAQYVSEDIEAMKSRLEEDEFQKLHDEVVGELENLGKEQPGGNA